MTPRPTNLLTGAVLACTALLACGGCRTTVDHGHFSEARVGVLEPGLSERHVVALFGEPDEVGHRRFGVETDYPWRGLVYRYHMSRAPDGRIRANELVFDTTFDPPLLDHFMIVEQIPNADAGRFADIPADFVLDLPGMSDGVNQACGEALAMMGAEPIYRFASHARAARFLRSRDQSRDIAARIAELTSGDATPERQALTTCYTALVDTVYDEPVRPMLSRLHERTIPAWVRERCQGRWWTDTSDDDIRALVQTYEQLRDQGRHRDAAVAHRDETCAPLDPGEGGGASSDERMAAARPWAACTHCRAAVIDFVYDQVPLAESHARELVREACHEATVGLEDPSRLIGVIYDALWQEKQAQGSRTESLAACTAAVVALESEHMARLESRIVGDATDQRRARLRLRDRVIECAATLTDLVYLK